MTSSLIFITLGLSVGGCVDIPFVGGIQGNGKAKTETRALSSFDQIELNMAGDVDVKFGNKPQIVVTAKSNLMPLIRTVVRSGKLVIDNDKDLKTKARIHFTVTTNKLSSFELNGAGDVNLIGVNAETLSLSVNGAGDIKGSGLASSLKIALRGAGDVHLFDLRSKSIHATLDGAGDMELTALDSLDAQVNGVGDIRYRGGAKHVNAQCNGVGTVSPG